jgi:phage terminase large subunit
MAVSSTAISPADARVVARRLADDPEWFVTEILGHDPWEVPRRILHAIAQPRARVAVKSCHSSGKTFTAAEIVLWWVFAGGIALTTAPTDAQVKEVLWNEIRLAHQRARFPLGGLLNQKEFRLAPDAYAIGLSTDQGVRFQGFHGRVLIVLDEAPGVRPDIYDAIRGIRAGGDVRLLALGNPVIASGPFYDAFTAQRSGWTTFTISAFDTPNLAGLSIEDVLAMTPEELGQNTRPYLPTRLWVKEMYEELGPRSPLYAARVLGEFPAQGEDSLLWLSWLEAARARRLWPTPKDPWAAGLDVAGPGEDETVLVVRHGPRIVAQKAWTDADPRGAVVALLREYADRQIDVYVDSIGIGYYMARHITSELQRTGKLQVHAVNVGEQALDPERYANWKAELYWGLRQRCEQGDIAGLTDDVTISQMAGLRYKHTARGQVQIESKEDARRRGVRSPDRAEAVMLAFARPHQMRRTFRAGAAGERPTAGYTPR